MQKLYKMKIKIGELFEKLNIEAIDEVIPSKNIFIKTPEGKLTEIRGFIKKSPKDIYEYEFENGIKIKCSDEHLVQENGITKKIKDCKYVDTINGKLKIVNSKFVKKDYVYDISIDAPHLYITPNGIIHHNTSLVTAIQKELNTETLWLNGSKENNVDTFRYKVSNFASKTSFNGKFRLVICDESDYLTVNSQALLRNDTEAFSKTARFIFTGNYPDRLIEPLLQRLQVFDFDRIFKTNAKELTKQIYERLVFILENENIKYNKEDILKVIKAFYPSTRAMIMTLQKNVIGDELQLTDFGIKSNEFTELFEIIKTRKYNDIRQAVTDLSMPIDSFYDFAYKHLDDYFEPASIPKVVILLAEYQDMSMKAKNKEIPLLAFITKLIGDKTIQFKNS